MQRVINFSGGKTSAYMTIKYYKPGDLVIFCDTGREHFKTYKFINDFEAFENIPVIRLSYDGGFRRLLEKTKAIPNRFKRFCTIELKVKTARRYLRSIGLMKYENLVGFRFDEPLRIQRRKQHWKQVIDIFPLNEDRITKSDITNFWKNKLYTLELEPILGNCTLCFNKGKNNIITILSKYPDLANEWIKDETLNMKGNTYFNGITIKELLEISKLPKKQYDLFELLPAYDCACTA